MMCLLISQSQKYSHFWAKGQNLDSHLQFPSRLFPASLIGYKILICPIFLCVGIHPVAAPPVVLDVTYPSPLLEDDASISKNCNCSV